MNSDFLLQEFFEASGDEIFVCDLDGKVLYKNPIAKNNYQKIKNIKQLTHIFDFEICILNNDDILAYTPISAALQSKENFCASVIKQLDNMLYAEYTITSFYQTPDAKIIILRNDTNIDLSTKYRLMEEKTKKLEDSISDAQGLKAKLEKQILKTGLINLVSEKVQKYIDTDKILKITLSQLKKTLDIVDVKFSRKENSSKKISIKIDGKNSRNILIVPIFQNKKVFLRLFYLTNSFEFKSG